VTLEEQQATVNDRLDRAVADLLADFPSISPRIVSIVLIDIATQYAKKQGASIDLVLLRARKAFEEIQP
jgi:hypothetical protein